jgi:hypothetical protein
VLQGHVAHRMLLSLTHAHATSASSCHVIWSRTNRSHFVCDSRMCSTHSAQHSAAKQSNSLFQ